MRNVMRWNKHGWLAGNVVSGTPHGPRSTIARGSVELFGRDSFVMLGGLEPLVLFCWRLTSLLTVAVLMKDWFLLVGWFCDYSVHTLVCFSRVRLRGGSSSGERTFELMWEGINQCDMRFAGFGGVVEQCSPVVHIGNNHRILTVGDW